MRRKAQARKISSASVDHETDELEYIFENTQTELASSSSSPNNNNSKILSKLDLISECDLNCMPTFKRKSHGANTTRTNEAGAIQAEKRTKQEENNKFDACNQEEPKQVEHDDKSVHCASERVNSEKSTNELSVSSTTNLKEHFEFISTKLDLAVSCTYCGKSFASNSGLKQHMHIHGSVKPYMCDQCPKAYTQFSNLCRHKRSHYTYENNFICRFCHLSFESVLELDKHKFNCKRKKRVKIINENSSS